MGSTARAVPTKLLQSENEIGNKIFNYIINKRTGNTDRNKNEQTTHGVFDDDDGDDHDDSMILRNMCLNILANSLRAYGMVPDFCEPLRRVLVQDLKNAEQHSNAALFSAKCMEYFTHPPQNTAVDLCNYEAFQIAHNVGEARHANLLCQAQKCMIATIQ